MKNLIISLFALASLMLLADCQEGYQPASATITPTKTKTPSPVLTATNVQNTIEAPGRANTIEVPAFEFPTPVPPTVTRTATQPKPEATQTTPMTPPLQIAEGEAIGPWWSEDSKIIYFFKGGSYWGYELETGRTHPADVREPIPTMQKSPSGFDQKRFQAWISPSGEKVFFTTLLAPTPTLIPDLGEGDQSYIGWPADLWIWESGVTRSIGRINNCIADVKWSPNNDRILLSRVSSGGRYEFGSVPACKDTFAWYIDVDDNRLVPLEVEDKDQDVNFFEYSPNGDWLPYREGEILYLIETRQWTKVALNIPRDNYLVEWIDDQTLLVRYSLHLDVLAEGLGIYSVSKNAFAEIVSEQTAIRGYVFAHPAISPDKNWLVVEVESVLSWNGLWLIDLTP